MDGLKKGEQIIVFTILRDKIVSGIFNYTPLRIKIIIVPQKPLQYHNHLNYLVMELMIESLNHFQLKFSSKKKSVLKT